MGKLPQSSADALQRLMAQPLERPPSRSGRAWWILFVASVALLAGVVGGLLAPVLLTVPSPDVGTATAFGRRPSLRDSANATPPLAPLLAGVVDVVAADASVGVPDAMARTERRGRGMVVTSDGWIVTVRSALDARPRRIPIVATSARRLAAVERVAFDPVSDLVFLHVAGLEASVLPLRDRDDLRIGDRLFAPAPDGGAIAVTLRARAALGDGGTIHTSDRWRSVLVLTDVRGLLPGTPLVDAAGAVVAILLDGDRALPIAAMTSALPGLFADGAVTRNVLGVSYRDAADFAYRSGALDGIIVAAPRGGSAFTASSPLKDAVALGDTILAVGDEKLSARRFLADLLQEYPVGATVPLTVVRAVAAGVREPTTVSVTLTKASGEALTFAGEAGEEGH